MLQGIHALSHALSGVRVPESLEQSEDGGGNDND